MILIQLMSKFLLLCWLPVTLGQYPVHHLQPPTPPCSDYEMLIVNTRQCVSRCPIRCVNGVCFEDGVCPCEGFYTTSFELGLTCATDCLPGCKEAGGHCATTDLCLCGKGLYFNAVAQRCLPNVISIFKDRCRGQCLYGTCSAEGVCTCAQGFAYQDTLVGQRCTPICAQNCGPQGYCHLPNMCACRKKHHHYESDGRCHGDSIFLGAPALPMPIKLLQHAFHTFTGTMNRIGEELDNFA